MIQKIKMQININLILVLTVVFIDLLGVGLIIPILPVLIGKDNINFGLLIALYPISQLFGAPVLGYFSDIYGRKKIMILSIAGTILSYLLFIIGIFLNVNIWILFLSRIVDGFTGGNIFIAHSMIADSSTPQNRAKNLGFINISLGLGMILGPVIGGFLSDVSIFNISPFAIPYIFAALISLFNLIFIIFYLGETAVISEKPKKNKLHIFLSFQQIYKAFKIKKLRLLFIISYLSSFSFSLFSTFFPQYLSINFNFTPKSIGLTTAYIGLWLAIGVIFALPVLNKKLPDSKLMYLSSFGIGLFLCLTLVPENPFWLYFILPVIAICMALTATCVISLLSRIADNSRQGEILGINQSVQAFATTAPFIGGFLSSYWIKLPFLLAAIATFISFWLVYYKYDLKMDGE